MGSATVSFLSYNRVAYCSTLTILLLAHELSIFLILGDPAAVIRDGTKKSPACPDFARDFFVPSRLTAPGSRKTDFHTRAYFK